MHKSTRTAALTAAIGLAGLLSSGASFAGGNVPANNPGGAGGLTSGGSAAPTVDTVWVWQTSQNSKNTPNQNSPTGGATGGAGAQHGISCTPPSPSLSACQLGSLNKGWDPRLSIQACMAYNANEGAATTFAANLKSIVATLSKQVLDSTGKPNFAPSASNGGNAYPAVNIGAYCVLLTFAGK